MSALETQLDELLLIGDPYPVLSVSRERADLAQARVDLRALDDGHVQEMLQYTSDLLVEVQQLRAGATESDIVVRGITREIRALDNAKRNLVASMTAIKRFQMLGARKDARWG